MALGNKWSVGIVGCVVVAHCLVFVWDPLPLGLSSLISSLVFPRTSAWEDKVTY